MDLIKPFINFIVFPAMEVLKSNKIRKYTKELINTQSLPYDEIVSLQEEKLKNLLLYCVDKVPAYKSFGHLRPLIEEDPIKALRQFDALEKDYFQDNMMDFLSDGRDLSSLIPNRTGGSSGRPTKFYLDRVSVEHYEAARWRGLASWGITPGSRSIMLWSNHFELDKTENAKHVLKEKLLKNRIVMSAYELSADSMVEKIRQIDKYRPEYFYGYSTALYSFAKLMLEQGLSLKKPPKVVVSTAELLHEYQREVIKEGFKCDVTNEYGARDGGIVAYQCRKGRMHVMSENLVLEIIDDQGKPCKVGESGHVLVTDLNNYSMPRLRYKLGDRASLSEEICDCGINLPVMNNIDGREDDMFVLSNGTQLHGSAFRVLARATDSIKQFKIVQKSITEARLYIIKSDDARDEEINKYISDVEDILVGVEVGVEFVDDIAPTSSGKYRSTVREF